MTLKRDHEACEEHNVIIERIKVLEKLPSLFSWMNITKGVGFLLVVMLTILFGITMTTRSELFEKQKEQEKKIENQVSVIRDSVSDIKTSVAVMVSTFELSQKQTAREIEELKNKK